MEASGYGYGSYCGGGSPQLAMEKQACEQFVVEDLLDFSEDDCFGGEDEVGLDQASADGSTSIIVGSSSNCSSGYGHFSGDLGSRSFAAAGLSDELCAPHDELAELEWLSNFVEESFSNDDIQKLHLISGGIKSPSSSSSGTQSGLSTAQARSSQASSLLLPETHVPGKPRSRRSRSPAPTSWSSSLLVLFHPPTCSEAEATPASSRAVFISKKAPKPAKRDGSDRDSAPSADGQKCLHCASEKTPQWRAGPMGPKTLCNACGVRYKSGRLVPEYRPAASPTFLLSEHSNSHRKVLELRRQKEALVLLQQQRSGSGQFMHHSEVYQSPAGGGGGQFLIHSRVGRPADLSQPARW